MPSSKRVSLKGKGADIFFGDYPELGARPATAETVDPPPPATGADTGIDGAASQPAARLTPPPLDISIQAREQESKHASLQASKITGPATSADAVTGLTNGRSATNPTRVSTRANKQESKEAREQESKNASMQAGETADMAAPGSADAVASPPDGQAREQARMQESKLASLLAGAIIGATASAPADIPESAPVTAGLLAAEAVAALMPLLGAPATITNAFRYTDEELSWLADAAYVLSKRYRIRLAKQDIVRLGLNAILWDWQERGEDSLLSTWANRRASRETSRK